MESNSPRENEEKPFRFGRLRLIVGLFVGWASFLVFTDAVSLSRIDREPIWVFTTIAFGAAFALWPLRLGRFAFGRSFATLVVLGAAVSAGVFVSRHPTTPVSPPKVRGEASYIDPSLLHIHGVKNGMSSEEIFKILGKPDWQKEGEMNKPYGRFPIQTCGYSDPELEIVFLEDTALQVSGTELGRKSGRLVSRGDRREKVRDLFGVPNTYYSRDRKDVFGVNTPAIIVEFKPDDTVERVQLGEM